MSQPADSEYLHLRLGDPPGERAVDTSGRGRHGTFVGGVPRAWDARFGACVAFSDDGYVSAPDPFADAAELTLSLWARGGAGTAGVEDLAGTSVTNPQDAPNDPGPALWRDGRTLRFAFAAESGEVPEFFRSEGGWVHVAWVATGEVHRVYRDGVAVHEAPRTTPRSLVDVPERVLRAGRTGASERGRWSGRLAGVRAWRRALDVAEIGDVMREDEVVPFRSSHPIDIELTDTDGAGVLAVHRPPLPVDPTHRLTVRNTADRPIVLRALTATTPGPDAHHLRLRFRRGVLALPSVPAPAHASGDWLGSGVTSGPDGDCVHLLRRGGDVPATLAAGDALEIPVGPLSAAPGGGPRTVRAELSTRAVTYALDAPPEADVEETRTVALSVADHTEPRAPLHVDLVGSRTVIANGRTTSSLTIQVTSTLPAGGLELLGPALGQEPFRLLVSAPQSPPEPPGPMPWVLCTTDQFGKTVVTSPDDGWEADQDTLGGAARWSISPRQTTSLEAGRALTVVLSGIVTAAPVGTTHLTVGWSGLSEFAEGEVELAVEKAALAVDRTGGGRPDVVAPDGLRLLQPDPVPVPRAAGLLFARPPGTEDTLLEVRSPATGSPRLEFARGDADAVARLRMTDKGTLVLDGAGLGIGTEDMSTNATLAVNGSIAVGGNDLHLGHGDTTRGDTGPSRALVKDENRMLTINYGSDFAGVRINGPVTVGMGLRLTTKDHQTIHVWPGDDNLMHWEEVTEP